MKEYKYICKLCKKHPTSEENQLCSECRNKKMGDTQRCIICGNVHTAAPDGICYKCRRAHPMDCCIFEGNICEAWACMDGLAGVGRWPVL